MKDEENPAARIESALTLLFMGYAEPDAGAREKLLSRAVTDQVEHWARTGVVSSREELSRTIGLSLENHNGVAPQRRGELQTFNNVARFVWSHQQKGRYNIQLGESYVELADDGRIKTIVNFSDPPHNVVVNGGPAAYVAAWNSDTTEQRINALKGTWSSDSRWVESKFDVTGADVIGARMSDKIHLDPVDGVMDVIQFDGAGTQVRFEVEVGFRDGGSIGTFTDFVGINAAGKVTRLAGFKGRHYHPHTRKARLIPPGTGPTGRDMPVPMASILAARK